MKPNTARMSTEPLLNEIYPSQSIIYGTATGEDDSPPYSPNPEGSPSIIDTGVSKDNRYYKNHGPIRTFFIICNLACISLANTAVTGMLIIGIPEIARRLAIPEYLLLW